MRLGQLSRKLAIRQSAIVEFLAGKQIIIEDGSNTRLEDDHVLLIMQQFAPTRIGEVTGEEEKAEDVPEQVAPVDEPSLEETQPVASNPEVEEVTEEKPEVIKAPKVELPGLKVLGKIEFPEPKKKEIPEIDPTPVTEETHPAQPAPMKPRPEIRKQYNQGKDRRDQRPKKNPIALQREREAMEAEKKRKEETERKKELRKQHYYKKVKPAAPTKAMKLMNEPVEEMTAEHSETPPKTQLGRFFKWLTT